MSWPVKTPFPAVPTMTRTAAVGRIPLRTHCWMRGQTLPRMHEIGGMQDLAAKNGIASPWDSRKNFATSEKSSEMRRRGFLKTFFPS